jgi:hypothetical protein
VTVDVFVQIVCEMTEAFCLCWTVFGIHCIEKKKGERINKSIIGRESFCSALIC